VLLGIVESEVKAGKSKEKILDALVKMTASEQLNRLAEKAHALEEAVEGRSISDREFIAVSQQIRDDFNDLLKQHGLSPLKSVHSAHVIHFVESTRRGQEILGAPRAEGFHWIGWLMPFVLLAVGVPVVCVFLKRLQKKTAQAQPSPQSAPVTQRASSSQDYEARLDEELKEFEF
jgi:cytochrome c-type biogenesis protein CcmH/NrfF